MKRLDLGALGAELVSQRGSTRAVSLMRIGLPLIAWSEWARPMTLASDLDGPQTVISISFFLSTLAMLVGWRSRLSSAWAGLSIGALSGYHAGVLHEYEFAHHHSYLILAATLLLALTPCGGSYSLDRWRAVRRAEREGRPVPDARGDLWAVRLLALQLSAIYFWGAYHKATNWGFVSGQRLEQISMSIYFGSDYPSLPGFHALMMTTACLTIALELVLAFGLWSRAAQPVLVPAGIAFHLVIYYLLPVATFSASMCLLYLAYLPPEVVDAFLTRVSGDAPRREDHSDDPPRPEQSNAGDTRAGMLG